MKNSNSFKDKIKILKEIWQVPRYKALIILCLYAIMFILLFSLAGIYRKSDTNSLNDTKSETNLPSLNEILNNNLNRDAKIKYTITNDNFIYVIDGEIKNNLLTGYLETNEII